MTTFSGIWSTPTFVSGVDDMQLDAIRGLFNVWQAKYPRNYLRSQYRDMKVRIKPSGNIPAEAMARIEAVSEWPDKAVTALAERSVFEGFVTPTEDQDPFDLQSILRANRFGIELPQAIDSTYTHSCSFITTAAGDTQAGEPEVVVMAREATWSAARWDSRRRTLRDLLCITETDDNGQPTEMDVLLPDVVITLTRRSSGAWRGEARPHDLREVPAEPLVHSPSLTRPFGRPRINRAVMNITDRALLTIVRSEIASDFYAVPRTAILGVAEDAFRSGKWQAAVDVFLALTRDEDGNLPEVRQLPQLTMQPLTDMYRMIATQFSGATGVPVSNLGIVTENPPSAEALYADDRRLVNTARKQNRIMGESLVRMAERIVKIRDGRTEGIDQIEANWANPAFTSPATSADALVKLAKVFPWIGDSEVALEFAGFSHAEVTRLLSDKRRAAGGGVLAQLLAARGNDGPQ